MYNIENKYLYEILLDYKDSNYKEEIFDCFVNRFWSIDFNRIIYEKSLKFKVEPRVLSSEIGKLFNEFSTVNYLYYKSNTTKKDYISLIRQKTNNIYTYLCDGRICTSKEYINLIGTPKRLYYRWISGENYKVEDLKIAISNSIEEANRIKELESKKKLDISFDDYKKLVNRYFKKIFDNYMSLDDYEDKNNLFLDIDIWTEDNFAVKYFCKCLNGYMRNYQKEYFKVKRNKKYRHCSCGGLIDISTNQYKCNICKEKAEYKPIVNKVIKCIDCGKEVKVGSLDNQTIRCNICYKVYRKNKIKENVRNYRKK